MERAPHTCLLWAAARWLTCVNTRQLLHHTPHPLKPRDVENTVGCRVSPTFAAHPLNGADSLGPHADEAVVFEDVAEFVLAERIGPGDR